LQNHIDKEYEKIIEDLRSAAECSVPQHQKNSTNFDGVKNLIASNKRLLIQIGFGLPLANLVLALFLTTASPVAWLTRKRLRDEQRNETSSYTNAFHDALIQKKGPAFWKCWRSKFTTSSRCIEVDGCSDSMVIADNFSNYFKKI